MTNARDTLLGAWQSSREATLAAQQKKNEAQAHWQRCVDQERAAWLALQDAQWNETKTSDASGQPVEESTIIGGNNYEGK